MLPIGQLGKDGMISLVDKVREALSIPDIDHTKRGKNDKTEVILAAYCELQITKKVISTFLQIIGIQRDVSSQHSRATSPRRLIKQVALESPHTIASDELSTSHQHQHTTSFKVISHEIKSDKANAKEESYSTQRQRLRKIGPFAVDSQQIPDSRIKYAGSWAPQAASSKGETQNQHDDNGGGGNEYDSEHKTVRLPKCEIFSSEIFVQ